MSDVAMPARAVATWDWARNGAIAGVAAVVFWVVGFLIVGNTTNHDEAVKILAAYKAHDDKILIGTVIFLLGVICFFFFLGALRSRLLAAEGGEGGLTAVAFAGGVATAVMLALAPATDAAGALNQDHLDLSGANAMHKLGDAFFLGAEYLLPVLLFATALIALRTAVLPKWLAWLTIVIGVVLLVGPIGWLALIFAFPIWVLIVSALMWTSSSRTTTV
jgi:hypothetical protein